MDYDYEGNEFPFLIGRIRTEILGTYVSGVFEVSIPHR